MSEKGGIRCPEGTILVTRVDDEGWSFEYPRISWEVMEEFHAALEDWRAGELEVAEEAYRQLIESYPELIDVHHHLALVFSYTDREEQAFQTWREVVALGLSCLPAEFQIGRDRLPWIILENRPFLRAYHGLGLEYLERGKFETALEIFDNMLALNPGDNQGVRALVIDCNFHLKCPKAVLAVCSQYPDDGMEQVVYGKVLALYQLGRRSEAEKALDEAIEFLPLVAKELVKKRHPEPKDLHPGYVTHGGADQAYYYWLDQGEHWKKTPGVLEFVRERLREHRS